MAAQIQNGIEIEVVVRSRKNGQSSGKIVHSFVVSEGESANLSARNRIATDAKGLIERYMSTRLVGPAE